MTRQETFDLVARALVKQGAPSIDYIEICDRVEVKCRYRGAEGRRCAAGHLIADEDYDRDMEGSFADGKPVAPAIERGGHANNQDPNAVTGKRWLSLWAEYMRGKAQVLKLSTAALEAALVGDPDV